MLDEDSPRRPMVYPQVLEFSGRLRRDLFEQALQQALQRHPLFQCRLARDAQGRPQFRETSPARKVSVHWRCEDAGPLTVNAYRLDLAREGGARIIVQETSDRTIVYFLWHHAFTDGIGSFRCIGDLLAYYAHLVDPTTTPGVVDLDRSRLKVRGESMSRGPELNVKPVTASEMMVSIVAPLVAREAAPLTGARRARFENARQPFPGLILKEYDVKGYTAIRKAAENRGLTAHDLLTFATFRFAAQWNQSRGKPANQEIRLCVPVDLRGRGDDATPAANVVGMQFLSLKSSDCLDDARLLESVKNEAIRTRTEQPAARMNQTLALAYAIPKAVAASFRGNRCMSTCILSNVGDPTRRFTATLPRREGKLVIGDVVLEKIYGISPMRRGTRLGIGAQTYNRQLVLSMRSDPYRFSLDDTRRMMDEFVAVIDSLVSLWR